MHSNPTSAGSVHTTLPGFTTVGVPHRGPRFGSHPGGVSQVMKRTNQEITPEVEMMLRRGVPRSAGSLGTPGG